MRERMTILANRWRAYGFDLDMNELVYFGDRNEPASYLSDNGWLLTEIKSQDLLTASSFNRSRTKKCRCLISSMSAPGCNGNTDSTQHTASQHLRGAIPLAPSMNCRNRPPTR